MAQSLKIIHIASEVSPFSKSGGLADVVNALTTHLSRRGHQVLIITPYYGFIGEKVNKGEIKTETIAQDISVLIEDRKYVCQFKKANLKPNLPVYFICQYDLFGRHNHLYGYENDNLRFLVFNLAALKLLNHLKIKPNIIHCHDWQTGLIPNYLKKSPDKYPDLKKSATIFTIHNLSFQCGSFWGEIPKEERDRGKNLPNISTEEEIKKINFAKRGIRNADIVSTVSERYAQEILTPEFGQELDGLLRKRKEDVYGIINGIDYRVFNPATDKDIYYNYNWNSLDKKEKNKLILQKELGLEQNKDIPILGMTHRLTEQKGFKLIMKIIKPLLRQSLQLVIVGSGHKEYINFFKKFHHRYPSKIAIVTPFSEKMERKIFSEKMEKRVLAGSDMYLMPSRFEPCGISQLKSLRYGSIPIVRETGGLSDTITDFNPLTGRGNGFVFKSYEPEDMLIAITRAVETFKYRKTWIHLVWQGMKQSFSWDLPTKKYLTLYRRAIKKSKIKNKDVPKISKSLI